MMVALNFDFRIADSEPKKTVPKFHYNDFYFDNDFFDGREKKV
jgi:hypothetical protein